MQPHPAACWIVCRSASRCRKFPRSRRRRPAAWPARRMCCAAPSCWRTKSSGWFMRQPTGRGNTSGKPGLYLYLQEQIVRVFRGLDAKPPMPLVPQNRIGDPIPGPDPARAPRRYRAIDLREQHQPGSIPVFDRSGRLDQAEKTSGRLRYSSTSGYPPGRRCVSRLLPRIEHRQHPLPRHAHQSERHRRQRLSRSPPVADRERQADGHGQDRRRSSSTISSRPATTG